MTFNELIKEYVDDTILLLNSVDCNYCEYMTYHKYNNKLVRDVELYYTGMIIYESTKNFKDSMLIVSNGIMLKENNQTMFYSYDEIYNAMIEGLKQAKRYY